MASHRDAWTLVPRAGLAVVSGVPESLLGASERTAGTVIERAAFFETPDATMFSMTRMPIGGTRSGVIVCSPIYLDKVKAHRAEVEFGRTMAVAGVASFHFDYSSFGNSGGDSADVSLDDLIRDAVGAARHLMATTEVERIGFLGVRFGALVAAGAAAQFGDAPVGFWDAAYRPSQYYREAMRARLIKDAGFVPSKLDHGDRGGKRDTPTQSTAELIGELEDGGQVDVLGYPVTGAMYLSSHERVLASELGDTPRSVLVFESGGKKELRRAARDAIDRWTACGLDVTIRTVPTEAWWFIGESLRIEEWVTASADWYADRLGGAR